MRFGGYGVISVWQQHIYASLCLNCWGVKEILLQFFYLRDSLLGVCAQSAQEITCDRN